MCYGIAKMILETRAFPFLIKLEAIASGGMGKGTQIRQRGLGATRVLKDGFEILLS